MKKILGLSLASLISFNAAAQSLSRETPAGDDNDQSAAPRLLLSQHGERRYEGITQYAALIEMPDKSIIECSGLKIEFKDYLDAFAMKGRDAPMQPPNPETFVSSPEVAYDLRPSPDPQPPHVKSYGSCKPYPLPDRIVRAMKSDNVERVLMDYMGEPTEEAIVTLKDLANGHLMARDWGTFVVDIHLNSYPNLPKAEPGAPTDDAYAIYDRKQYKLDMPACVNSGYNEGVANAIINGGPLPKVIPLRSCAP
jgi:hypothetical protein